MNKDVDFPAMIHSALFFCPEDGEWARARAAKIGDVAFVLETTVDWLGSPSQIAAEGEL